MSCFLYKMSYLFRCTKSLQIKIIKNNNNNNSNYKNNNNTNNNNRCSIIPVIIGVTGIVTRSLRKNIEDIPEKHSIDSLQKTPIIGTSHITRRVLQC